MPEQIDIFEKEMEAMDKHIEICKEQAHRIRDEVSAYDRGVEELRQMSTKIEEINQSKKRWWHFFKSPSPHTFEIEGRPVFTEQQLAERRAFLDGYDAGRKDGDKHDAYNLWRKMIDHSDK